MKQVFFSVWFFIVGVFVLLMVAFYRKNTRSNFRKPQDGPPPRKINVDARRLPGKEKADLVVKNNSPSKR